MVYFLEDLKHQSGMVHNCILNLAVTVTLYSHQLRYNPLQLDLLNFSNNYSLGECTWLICNYHNHITYDHITTFVN